MPNPNILIPSGKTDEHLELCRKDAQIEVDKALAEQRREVLASWTHERIVDTLIALVQRPTCPCDSVDLSFTGKVRK